MHVDPNSPHATLTKRQQEVLDRLGQGMGAREIAHDIGVSRNAVYQHIDRLRRQGALEQSYTPSGQPPRRIDVGSASFTPAIAPRESAIARLRELAMAGADRDDAGYAAAIEAAIAKGDAPALAYELPLRSPPARLTPIAPRTTNASQSPYPSITKRRAVTLN